MMGLPTPRRIVRSGLKRLLAIATANAALRRLLILGHAKVHARDGFYQPHPFDRRMGIAAGGFLPSYLIPSGAGEDAHSTAYLGCAPDTLRRALSLIPDPQDWAFLDLGCGMGRALVMASGFPFRSILGIELSPDLVRRARANAAIVAARHPERPAITVEQGDASRPRLTGPTVVMLYHPFGGELVARLVRCLEAAVGAGHAVIVLYLNPVHGDRLDASAVFSRLYADTVPHSAEDHEHAPDDDTVVVAWQAGAPKLPPRPGCDKAIIVAKVDWQARLEA